jgi:hypothetical protein
LVIDAATGEPADLTEMAGALDATYARLGLRP